VTGALISEETIRLVRDRTDIQAVVGETVKLTRRGRSWVGLCPFHKERSPSFHVTPERGIFHCFGCGEHGNAFDFLMKVEGLSFPESVRRLAERAGVEIEENRSPAARREEDAARKMREDLYGINALAASFYERMMGEHPHGKLALEELGRRGLVPTAPTDPIATALQGFRVGYAPAEWAGLTAFLRQQGVSPSAAEQAGLLLPRSSGGGFYDRFRNRLMFAVIDLQGRVVGFSGRILPDPQTGLVDKETGKYINSPETPVYRKGELVFGLFQARQSIRQAEQAVLVEGNFDVVSLHARGITNVVAPLGTAFTPEQATAIKRFAPEIVLLFDGDAAGRKAVRSAREPCKKAGLVARAATLPEGVDPDELSRDRGPDAVRAVIQAARGLLEHLVDASLDARFTSASAEERAERVREVVELINAEDDPTVRAMAQQFADDVARRLVQRDDALGMADATTFRALVRAVRAGVARSAPTTQPQAPTQERDWVMEEVLGALLDFPSLLHKVDESLWSCVSGDAALVVAVLQETDPERDAEKFLANLPTSFQSFALQRLTAPVYSDLTTAKTQLEANLRKLQVRALQQEHALLKSEAARAERQGDFDAEIASLREIEERTRRRMQLRSRGPGGPQGSKE
jgi:DNA primase